MVEVEAARVASISSASRIPWSSRFDRAGVAANCHGRRQARRHNHLPMQIQHLALNFQRHHGIAHGYHIETKEFRNAVFKPLKKGAAVEKLPQVEQMIDAG
jgi:hypothetical protein